MNKVRSSPTAAVVRSIVIATLMAGAGAILIGFAVAGVFYEFFEDPDADFYGLGALVYGVGAAFLTATATYLGIGIRGIFRSFTSKERIIPSLTLLVAPLALFALGRLLYVATGVGGTDQAHVFAFVISIAFATAGPTFLVWLSVRAQALLFNHPN